MASYCTEQEEDDDDVCLGAIGFMFDAQHARCTKKLSFESGINVEIRLIGEDPGHVQSGQYLWPAAAFTAQYLIDHWSTLQSSSIVELGAGVGVAGLVASQLPGCNKVVFTDYDPGALQLIEENVSLNKHQCNACQCGVMFLQWGNEEAGRAVLGIERPTGSNGSASGSENSSSSSSSCSSSSSSSCGGNNKVEIPTAPSGDDNDNINSITNVICSNSTSNSNSSEVPEETRFPMVLGTDLLYSVDIVEPLFKSARFLMRRGSGETINGGGFFLLVSSFYPGLVGI